jgi:hypothetical protein
VLHLQVDGGKSADEVFEDVKPIFVELNTQVHIRVRSSKFLTSPGFVLDDPL